MFMPARSTSSTSSSWLATMGALHIEGQDGRETRAEAVSLQAGGGMGRSQASSHTATHEHSSSRRLASKRIQTHASCPAERHVELLQASLESAGSGARQTHALSTQAPHIGASIRSPLQDLAPDKRTR